MKGTNELRLNQATVVEALQEYFDKRYSPKVVVKRVAQGENAYDTIPFFVWVEEPAAEVKP